MFPTSLLARIWTAHSLELASALRRAAPNCDLLHIHELWHYPGYAAYEAARRFRKPYVVTIHGALDPWALNRSRLKKRVYMALVQRRVLDNAVALHVMSEAEKALVLGYNFRPPVHLVPNGVSVEALGDAPAIAPYWKRGPKGDRKVILFLGRIHHKKGLDILAKAFGEIARNRDDVVLVIAGPDEGGYRARVEAMLRDAGAGDQAIFTGMLTGPEKLAAFRAADIFVLPSYSEGFSMAVLEALAQALPVVISRQCNFPEVGDSRAGLIIEPEVNQLASALWRLLDSAEERRAMGECGKRLVMERYSWDAIAEQIIAMYQQTLGVARAGVSAD